jgi:hypothetical protein
MKGAIKDSTMYDKGRDVFGQVGDIVYVEKGIKTDLRKHGKAVLIWWTHGPGCERSVPDEALRGKPGEEVFLGIAPRPRDEWINDMPTYDADYRYQVSFRVYSPTLEKGHYPGDESSTYMTPSEYGNFYKLLPGNKKIGDLEASWPRVRDWARAHPEVARRQPACEWIASFDDGICSSRSKVSGIQDK